MGKQGQGGESEERQWGREGEMGTLFPVIAADFPDVICHSKGTLWWPDV